MKLGDPKLKKVGINISFKPDIMFYDWLYPTAQEIINFGTGFDNWETDRLTVILRDLNLHRSFRIAYDSIIYEQDNHTESAFDTATEIFSQEMKMLLDAIPRGGANALQFSYVYLARCESTFSDLAKIFEIKLMGMAQSQRDALGALPVTDFMYKVCLQEGELMHVVTAAPVWRLQFLQLVAMNPSHFAGGDVLPAINRLPNVGLFIRFDTSMRLKYDGAQEESPYAVAAASISEDQVSAAAESARNYARDTANRLCDLLRK